MKAGDLFMIQHCAKHGSFRVQPLQTCEDLARLAMESGDQHLWVVVGHGKTEGDCREQIKQLKKAMPRKAAEDGKA